MKRLIVFLVLCGCATTPSEDQVISAFNDFQAFCMAAEMDESYTADCVRAKYHLCREAAKQQRYVWYSHHAFGGRDANGYPRYIQDMRHEMAINSCYPRLP